MTYLVETTGGEPDERLVEEMTMDEYRDSVRHDPLMRIVGAVLPEDDDFESSFSLPPSEGDYSYTDMDVETMVPGSHSDSGTPFGGSAMNDQYDEEPLPPIVFEGERHGVSCRVRRNASKRESYEPEYDGPGGLGVGLNTATLGEAMAWLDDRCLEIAGDRTGNDQ